MVRPQKMRIVDIEPSVTYYKPQGIPLRDLEENVLSVDELEALRLADVEDLGQVQAAQSMGVHQSTINRVLARARQKVADALINGKAIRIEGGVYAMPGRDGTGPQGRGLQARGFGARPGNCWCPSCNHQEPHIRGQPCNQRVCPKCGKPMTRKD